MGTEVDIIGHISEYIAAVAALGTASYALVDGSKAVLGGVSNRGFGFIEKVMGRLYPPTNNDKNNPLALESVLSTLKANWINGTALADQKAIAKSLIKLRLDEANAAHLAEATGVDSSTLTSVAVKFTTGVKLDDKENDMLGRFDMILSALLDDGYKRADQAYRNTAKLSAVVVSILLALWGGSYVAPGEYMRAFLVGLLATPLAPVSKDLTSALQAAVKAMQVAKK